LCSVSYQPKAIPVLYDTQMEHTIIEKHYTVGVQTSNEILYLWFRASQL